jgi:hypothetical protein
MLERLKCRSSAPSYPLGWLGLSYCTCWWILPEVLNMGQLAGKFVMFLLNDGQKQNWFNVQRPERLGQKGTEGSFLRSFFLNIVIPFTLRSPKWSLSPRFHHQNPMYASSLPHTCLLHAPPISFLSIWSPTNAACNNDFVANLSDIASCSYDALTWVSSEYCRSSSSNGADILSYKTCIMAHSLTVTCVYITSTDWWTILWRRQTRMRNVSKTTTSCYYKMAIPPWLKLLCFNCLTPEDGDIMGFRTSTNTCLSIQHWNSICIYI